MIVYKTGNISDEEVSMSQDIQFTTDKNAPNWLYKGSLLSYLRDIPDDISSLIPLNYYMQKKFDKWTFSGRPSLSLRFKLESTTEVTSRIEEALEQVNFTNSFGNLKNYILTVCVELVRNGIIQNVKNEKTDTVSLDIIETEDDVFIKITDKLGNLVCSDLTSRLRETATTGEFERKEHGAGLGLFMVISSVDSIQFLVEPGEKTEVICRMNKYKRLKHFKEKETAIFFDRR